MSRPETPGLEALQEALDRGDIATVRRLLMDLDAEDQRLLAEEMGSEAFARARGTAARGARSGKLGKVLVLPGIMGTELDSVDRKGDTDRIWINFIRLIAGRIVDLGLNDDGSPAQPGTHVRIAGVHRKTYLPLLLELDTRWDVRPFGFDWREDIDKSAARLDGEIKAFGAGGPLHLVAHSMGGLVSRRFIQLFPDTWKAMEDTSGEGRGGRLIMVGTPNRGSFAIPLTLTGAEKLVKLLAKADVEHSPKELLAIIGTLLGLYQMLPSPLVELGDDHKRLFEVTSWGNVPVRKALLAKADKFQRALDKVTDPQRLLYIAGANLRTPVGIEVVANGQFSYFQSLDGDGRVPHELGLLEGVTTYWVDEGVHGDLVKHSKVLDGITELLQTGLTSVLPTTKPTARARRESEEPVPAEAVAPLSPEVDAILAPPKVERRIGARPQLTPEEQIRLENLAFDDYLGTGEEMAPVARAAAGIGSPRDGAGPPAGASPVEKAEVAPRRTLAVEVVWGDVVTVEADVYTVGHYEGVQPQRAELALDEVVSGVRGKEDYDPRSLVITQHTRRGTLRAEVGDVAFFPWNSDEHDSRVVAVAGMGRPGTFDAEGLRLLVHSVAIAVAALPGVRTACSVMIGSGEGTLTISEAAHGYVEGIADAADEVAAGGENVFAEPVEKLIIAELDRGRAEDILEAFREELTKGAGVTRARSIKFDLHGKVKQGAKGRVSVEEGLALLADTLVDVTDAGDGSPGGSALNALVACTGANQTVRKRALESLKKERGKARTSARPRFRVERRDIRPGAAEIPARISFWHDGKDIRSAAIDQSSTVPERVLRVQGDVVDELIAKMTDPDPSDVAELCQLLHDLLVPAEFGDLLRSGQLVFEVDRSTAQLHWEMLATRDGGESKPLAVRKPLARQLRTTYSPAPTRPRRPGDKLRALVVGDPGDPAKRQDLPGASREAVKVYELLDAHPGIDVDARIGAPGTPRDGPLLNVKPAERLDVLSLLLRGDYDLVHYAGHGDFDPAKPDRVGWVFAAGLLTPGEISGLKRVPTIVVSNACLSARTSEVGDGGSETAETRSEAGLLPSLADEFFKLGVRNYVGTAWEVNDLGAEVFAEAFYGTLLQGRSFGAAMKSARERLWPRQDDFRALWAAYQHYGDPSSDAGLASKGRDGG
jgi:pimeloyl-ACP methyl ester carboxylesterase